MTKRFGWHENKKTNKVLTRKSFGSILEPKVKVASDG